MRRRQTTVNVVFIRTGIWYLLPQKNYTVLFKRTRLYVKLFSSLIWLKAAVKIFF